MKPIKSKVYWQLVRAEKFDNAAGVFGGKTFFEVVDAVIFAGFVGEALDAVEVVDFEAVLRSVLNHIPLNGILGVVFAHIFFVAAGEKIESFIAIEHEHSGA